MIKLYTFGPAFNLPDPSPFVTKVDLTLKVSGLDYEAVADVNNLQKAPKGKLPYIDDHGQVIADSVFISEHLKQKHNIDLDGWLTPEQAAITQLVNKSLDENHYWVVVYSRWVDDAVWPIVRDNFFGSLPFPLKHIVPKVARKKVMANIMGHGLGKHSKDEIIQIAHHSWQSLSTLLGEKPFFFGDHISSLDVNAFANLSAFTLAKLDTDFANEIQRYPNLIEFTKRIAQQYYPDEIDM